MLVLSGLNTIVFEDRKLRFKSSCIKLMNNTLFSNVSPVRVKQHWVAAVCGFPPCKEIKRGERPVFDKVEYSIVVPD